MQAPVPEPATSAEADEPSRLDARLALRLIERLMDRRYAVPVRRGRRLRLPPPPGAPDQADPVAVRQWVTTGETPTAVDVFCGAGGLSLGLQDAGFKVLVGADLDPLAVETHVANLGGLGYAGDLSDPADFISSLREWGITTTDLLAGGVPCQPFSRAGRSKIRSLVALGARPKHDRRADLWGSFTEIAGFLRPRAILLENVPDLAQWDDGCLLLSLCDSLRELGYRTEARILHAYEHGVPQHRSRLFVVGLRAGEAGSISWPTASKRAATLWDAISDLPAAPGGCTEELQSYGGPSTALQRRLRRRVPRNERGSVSDHLTRQVRPDDAEAFALLPEGGTYLDIPERLRRYRSDIFTDKYKRLSRHELSRTITAHIAKDGYWYIHPTQDRTLSIREAARIQTFPDWFRFAGEPSHRLRQIGNAVPPLLAESLGSSLRRTLQASEPVPERTDADDARALLLKWHEQAVGPHTWRRGASPWAVLLAEFTLSRLPRSKLHQTYTAATQIAPNPSELIMSQEPRLALKKLGLGRRADDLVAVAEAIVQRHGGETPRTKDQLLDLPGIGDYLASAVMCFGFGRPAVLTDATTERIVQRLEGAGTRIGRWQTRLALYQLAGSAGPSAEFNHALLELGTTVCTPHTPKCGECPIRSHCRSGSG